MLPWNSLGISDWLLTHKKPSGLFLLHVQIKGGTTSPSLLTITLLNFIFMLFSIFYVICTTIGLFRSKPKNEYVDIEHGSSDWCEGGEQYKVLSKHKGILLAQEHYLPVDKRGNVNVLVVGRIWFW